MEGNLKKQTEPEGEAVEAGVGAGEAAGIVHCIVLGCYCGGEEAVVEKEAEIEK